MFQNLNICMSQRRNIVLRNVKKVGNNNFSSVILYMQEVNMFNLDTILHNLWALLDSWFENIAWLNQSYISQVLTSKQPPQKYLGT